MVKAQHSGLRQQLDSHSHPCSTNTSPTSGSSHHPADFHMCRIPQPKLIYCSVFRHLSCFDHATRPQLLREITTLAKIYDSIKNSRLFQNLTPSLKMSQPQAPQSADSQSKRTAKARQPLLHSWSTGVSCRRNCKYRSSTTRSEPAGSARRTLQRRLKMVYPLMKRSWTLYDLC